MYERGADQVAGDAVPVLDTAFADASAGKLFQFPERDAGGFLVRFDDAAVVHGDGENRNRFWRRANEVEVNPPRPNLLRCQLLFRVRVLVVAQTQERFPSDDLARLQPQLLSSGANPMTGLLLALGVIIVVGQVFVEIRLGHGPVLLWNAAKHTLPLLPQSPQPGCSKNLPT